MTTPTTYAEFEKSSSREPRVIVSLTVKNSSTGTPATLRFSTIAGPLDGLSEYLAGVVDRVPTTTYTSKEISGALPTPTYSGMTLIVPDGYDLSVDQSGIYADDFGSTWIVRDQAVSVSFGGDDLPVTEYRPTISGTVDEYRKTDSGGVLTISGAEKEIYRKTMALNKINSTQWPNAAENLGKSKPICIGLCYNVTPMLVNTVGNPTYLFNEDGTYTTLVVYEDAVQLTTPAQYTDNADGTFTLTYVPTGQVTCSVVGASGFSPWATTITDVMINHGGIVPGRIDAAAVAAADIALPYPVGYFVAEETKVMDVVSKLSQGIPAWWGFNSSADLFTMREVTDPAISTATHKISNKVSSETPIAFVDGTLSESPSGKVVWKVDFDYYPNYTPTPADRLGPALTLAQKIPFTVKWRTVTPASDAGVLTNYPFASSIKKFNRTSGPGSATALAGKWLALEKIERVVVKLKVPMMETYEVGDIVELTYETELTNGTPWYKHGYNQKKFLVLSVGYDMNDYTISLSLWA